MHVGLLVRFVNWCVLVGVFFVLVCCTGVFVYHFAKVCIHLHLDAKPAAQRPLVPHMPIFSVPCPTHAHFPCPHSTRVSSPTHPTTPHTGFAMPGTELRIVDPTTKQDLPDGHPGLLLARGPGVMGGYYKDPSATAAAFPVGDGWFDTGDLGWRAPPGTAMAGMIVLTGRAKDTIVLSSGKNVEPQPLEDACCVSPYVKHTVVVGSDHRALGALVAPDRDAIDTLVASRGML